jgi:excinuclease ABC subunit B
MGNPSDYYENVIRIQVGQLLSRNKFLHLLVGSLYSRTETDFVRGKFRVKGDTVDIYLAYYDYGFRVVFFGDEIESIESFDPISGMKIEALDQAVISPANLFVTTKDAMLQAIFQIQEDMVKHVDYLKEMGKHLEAKRLEDRVTFDLEMMRELGYCSGIENYSRYFDKRKPGARPFCLIDYFPKDYITIIDESHVTIPQIRGMYGGDRSRKINLVDYGFRLPAAMDNRPLQFDEFESLINQVIYVSATPADFELEKSGGIVVEQVIRPTGLLDPVIEVRPSINQVDDLLDECQQRIDLNERVLVTTLTKRMAEELAKYMANLNIRCRYIHSEVDTLERVEILHDLRIGKFDVLIGVNLLREGLDLPEVSLVAILDADKEGFLRSHRSLTQTAGRAARNVNGKVIMYADKITKSMQLTIDETDRRREKQIAYNTKHGLVPMQINKSTDSALSGYKSRDARFNEHAYTEPENISIAADPVVQYMNVDQLKKTLQATKKQMEAAAKELGFYGSCKT